MKENKNLLAILLIINIILVCIIGLSFYNKYVQDYEFNNPVITVEKVPASAKGKDIEINELRITYSTNSEYGIPDDIIYFEEGRINDIYFIIDKAQDYQSGFIDCKYEVKDGVTYITYFGDLIDMDGKEVKFEHVFTSEIVLESDNLIIDLD